jgi:hypothetical protein
MHRGDVLLCPLCRHSPEDGERFTTVKIHLHNIFRKLRVSNRTALAAMLFNRSRR